MLNGPWKRASFHSPLPILPAVQPHGTSGTLPPKFLAAERSGNIGSGTAEIAISAGHDLNGRTTSAQRHLSDILLEAPKTPFLTIEDYAVAAAKDAAINPAKFQRLITCESRWEADAQGDNGTSFGILQFKRPTFAHFSRKYGMTETSIEDPHHQIDLAVRMIANGHLEHWKNCSRKIGWSAA